MPRKRIESKRKDPLVNHPDAWLVLLCGWCFNDRDPDNPVFESKEALRAYWQDNRERLIREFTAECWVWHAFEPHDQANCEYCQRYNVESELSD
jgi:hypothetical protein